MTIELGIASFECNPDGCGALIYPPSSISTKAQKKHVEKIELPVTHTKISQEKLLTKKVYDEIQAGLHDGEPNLVRFKGVTYGECTSTLRAEYKAWRDDFVVVKRAEAGTKETELKTKAKSVLKIETEDAITLEAERYEAVYEGSDKEGRTLCPNCGKELCSWKT